MSGIQVAVYRSTKRRIRVFSMGFCGFSMDLATRGLLVFKWLNSVCTVESESGSSV